MQHDKVSDHPVLLFKYGGNAMVDAALQKEVLGNICAALDLGYRVVIVHGGGPFIKEILEIAEVHSEFIDGHRKTTEEAYGYVEMALKGKVNTRLVRALNAMGKRAVGLSGIDGRLAVANKRLHERVVDGKSEKVDLGQVGDIVDVNPEIIDLLLQSGYIPVLACVAADDRGQGYNVNADMFAGNIAGALKVHEYIVMTDVDGLLKDKDDPGTLIRNMQPAEIRPLVDRGVILGGMLPKLTSCEIALEQGCRSARIINGTKPEQILALLNGDEVGTRITKSETTINEE